MSGKGNTKVLDNSALDNTTFSVKFLARQVNDKCNVVLTEIKKLQSMDCGAMTGGQGDVIVETVEKTLKVITDVKSNIAKIASAVDTKLSKSTEAMRTTGQVAAARDTASGLTTKTSLQKS